MTVGSCCPTPPTLSLGTRNSALGVIGSYSDHMKWPRYREPEPSRKLEGKVQGWAHRAARGMDPGPEVALKQAQDVLNWSVRKSGPESSFSIKAMNEVANQLAGQDRVVEEVVIRQQIVAGLRTNLGPEHESTLSAEWKLATCLMTVERPEDAEPLLAHVVAGRTLALGQDDPQTLVAIAWKASVAKKLGRLHEARVLQEQVVAGYESLGEEESDRSLLALLNLAATLGELHESVEASRLLHLVLTVRLRTLGPDDPKTLEVLEILGSGPGA